MSQEDSNSKVAPGKNATSAAMARASRRSSRHTGDEEDLWLVSYGDLITLLFCFFGLMLSMSTLDQSKIDRVQNEVSKQFSDGSISQQSLANLEKELISAVAENKLKDDIKFRKSDQGLIMELNAKLLFDPGSSELQEKAMDVLDQVVKPILSYPILLQVEGHTDPVPIKNEKYQSNWELSANRATRVVRYLIDALDYPPNRLKASGFADTRPIAEDGLPMKEPLPESDWSDSYLARQRRVTFVISPLPKDNKSEKVLDTGNSKGSSNGDKKETSNEDKNKEDSKQKDEIENKKEETKSDTVIIQKELENKEEGKKVESKKNSVNKKIINNKNNNKNNVNKNAANKNKPAWKKHYQVPKKNQPEKHPNQSKH